MSVAIGARPPRSLLWAVLSGIVVLAWIALWWLEQYPNGWLFHRHGGTVGHMHEVRTYNWLSAAAFLTGWLLMTTAMMLPTTVPLVTLFRRMLIRRAHAPLLIALLLAGYLTAWLSFGTAALGAFWAIDQVVYSGVVMPQTWVWSAALFLLAGAFQFSRLKYACLDRCRTPLGFLVSHWHGRSGVADSFIVGWSHGLFCVGCCWALMLLMFAVGTASLGWMLLLAFVMAIEKNSPWGRRLGRPLGIVLLGAGVVIAVYNLTV